jgi:hypothetical protein
MINKKKLGIIILWLANIMMNKNKNYLNNN